MLMGSTESRPSHGSSECSNCNMVVGARINGYVQINGVHGNLSSSNWANILAKQKIPDINSGTQSLDVSQPRGHKSASDAHVQNSAGVCTLHAHRLDRFLTV